MRHKSRIILDGNERAGARAMLKGTGFNDDDLKKPIIGIANTWIETMPCNLGLRALAQHVKEGIRAAGGTPLELNTVAISDGVTMGTEGMKTSLVSREVIADSVELVGRGHMFDAMIGLGACDKTLPGLAMALARLNIPGFLLYGGTILPGEFHGKEVTIRSVYEAIGANAAGKMSDEELHRAGERRLPRRRRLRRPVHRQHDGDGDGVHRPLAAGHRLAAGRRRPQDGGRQGSRRADHGRAQPRRPAQATS